MSSAQFAHIGAADSASNPAGLPYGTTTCLEIIMAFSLPGERSLAPALSARPLAAFARWIVQVKAAQTRRAALRAMLDLDCDRLDDLGISRQDIADAMSRRGNGAMTLNTARARNARL